MSLYIRLLLSQNLGPCLKLRCVHVMLLFVYTHFLQFLWLVRTLFFPTTGTVQCTCRVKNDHETDEVGQNADVYRYIILLTLDRSCFMRLCTIELRTWWILYRANSKQSCDCVQRPVEVKISWNKNCFSRQTLLAFSVWCNPIKVWQLKWKY